MASRNVNSFFSKNPASLDISRSKFIRGQNIKLTFQTGRLIPFYVDEVLPGDSFSIDTSKVVRMSTPIDPVMDNIWLDTYYFFVPNRLVWDHWKNFMGESEDAWIPAVNYSVPQITAPANTGWITSMIADYFGIPTKVPGISVNALPFRAYALIWNEWFRDENLEDPIYIEKGDQTVVGTNGTVYTSDPAKGGYPAFVSKYHDYFTSALPAPQKGPDVPLPLGDNALVYASANSHYSQLREKNQMILGASNDGSSPGVYSNLTLGANGGTYYNNGSIQSNNPIPITPINLYADLTTATGTSINQLRQAFQVQKLYEKDARGGTRYIEQIKSHFGVSSPDARMQRPEYLGGSRVPINVHQVVQTSSTDSTSPQGNTGAYSLTIDSHSDFTKSFTEHGYVIGVMCARYDHTYQQGLERMWSRKLREDFYFPVFANLGEQAILNKEIYMDGSAKDDEVFGYQEAWAEYRYKPNRVSGVFRTNATGTIDFWHLADNYGQCPSLSHAWIRENPVNVDRVLTVSNNTAGFQFFADIHVRNVSVRPMPLYSIPGLIDHH